MRPIEMVNSSLHIGNVDECSLACERGQEEVMRHGELYFKNMYFYFLDSNDCSMWRWKCLRDPFSLSNTEIDKIMQYSFGHTWKRDDLSYGAYDMWLSGMYQSTGERHIDGDWVSYADKVRPTELTVAEIEELLGLKIAIVS
jgi:hypothetical protein